MKGIILPLLISYIFCANYLPKSGKITVKDRSGYFYLNTNEFEAGSTLYIHLNVKNGRIDSKLLYEFINISPHVYLSIPSNALTPTSTGSTTMTINQVTETYEEYYYSLKNENRYPYLIIQYRGFSGEYLEIDFAEPNGALILIIVFSVLGLICLIAIVCCICIICICRRKSNVITPQPVYPNPYAGGYPQQQQLQNIGPMI